MQCPTLSVQQPPEPKKDGRGRKPGQPNRFSKSSVTKLSEMGFDPLEKLVELYEQIVLELQDMEFLKLNPVVLENGDTRRYSGMAHAQLLTTQQKLLNDLMRYGYARVAETVTVKQDALPGITINMTPKGGVFDVDGVIEMNE